MFARSGFLRLVRPASNVIGRRGSNTPCLAPIANGSLTSASIHPVRSFNSSPVLNQSTTSATPEPIQSSSSTTTFNAQNSQHLPFEEVAEEETKHSNSVEETMAEYNGRKVSGPLELAEYETFLRALSFRRGFMEAYSIIEDMRQAGITVSSDAYAYALKAGRRSLRVAEIRELFGMPLVNRRDSHTNTPIDEEAQATNQPSPLFSKMKELRETMLNEGLELNTWYWDDTAAWLSGINNAGLLINIAIALEARGISPSTRFYTKMIYTLPRSGFADRADMLFNRMVLNGVADEHTYSTRLGALVYLSRYDEADKLFADMEAKYELDNVAYNTIIHGYLSADQYEKAAVVLEKMKASKTAQPDRITACTFISYFYESGRLEHANAMLSYFKESIGFPMSSNDRHNLIKFYGRYDPDQATRLLQELIKSEPNFDIEIYNAILSILSDRRVTPDWKRSIGDVVLDKSYPMKTGGIAEICASLPYHMRNLVARMEAYSVQPSAHTYDFLLRGLLVRKDIGALRTLYNLIGNQNLYPSHRNTYLAGLLAGGAPHAEIEAFLSLMKVRRWPVSSVNNRRLQEQGIKVPTGAFLYTQAKGGGVSTQRY